MVLTGCADRTTSPAPSTNISFNPPTCTPVNLGAYFIAYWPCNTTLRVRGVPAVKLDNPSLYADIATATSRWNAMSNPLVPGVPRFVVDSLIYNVTVILHGGAGAPAWCGFTTPTQVDLYPSTQSECQNGANTGPLTDALTHELSHVVGFQNAGEHRWTTGVSDQCTTQLPLGGGIVGTVCQHEIENVYAAYGYAPVPGANFWSHGLVSGLTVSPTSLDLNVGDSARITVSQLRFDPYGQISPQPLGGTVLAYQSDVPAVAIARPSGWVVAGLSAGSAVISVKIAAGLPSQYETATLMAMNGVQVPVTVTNPAPGFRVSNISGATQPITVAGTYPLTATVVNLPPGTLQVRWHVVWSQGPSGGPADSITTPYGSGAQYYLNVHEGSYNIRVTAMPRVVTAYDTTYGGANIKDYPVCTGGGGGDLAPAVPDDGRDAVQGC